MTQKIKPMSQKTNEEIYLEWVNDFLTIEEMADNYNMDKEKLTEIIDRGRIENHSKWNTPEFHELSRQYCKGIRAKIRH